jgi:hypothetical protein
MDYAQHEVLARQLLDHQAHKGSQTESAKDRACRILGLRA